MPSAILAAWLNSSSRSGSLTIGVSSLTMSDHRPAWWFTAIAIQRASFQFGRRAVIAATSSLASPQRPAIASWAAWARWKSSASVARSFRYSPVS